MGKYVSLEKLANYHDALTVTTAKTNYNNSSSAVATAMNSTANAMGATTAEAIRGIQSALSKQEEKHKTVLNKVKSMTAYDINSHSPNFTIHSVPRGWQLPDPEMVIAPIETEQDLLTGEVMITQVKLSKKIFDIGRYKMQHYPIIHCNLTSAEFDFAEECVKNRSIEDIEARWKQAEQFNVPFLDLLTEKEIIDISLLEYLQGDYK